MNIKQYKKIYISPLYKKYIIPGGAGRMFSRGGQLQVAGVVVGSWGPNYGSNGNDNRSRGVRHPVSGYGTLPKF